MSGVAKSSGIDEAGNALNPHPPLLPTPPTPIAMPCELSTLPAEIITDIFSRLPAGDLVKFRYLNKSYNSLIQSKCFVKLHLLKTLENINETRIWRVLMNNCYSHWLVKVEALDEYLGLKMSDKSAGDVVAPFAHPIEVPESYSISIIGSCNGLLCFYLTTARKFLVCNPCTGAHKYYAGDMVTGDSYMSPRFVWDQYGFGDDGTGRFKIVRLGRRHGSIKHDYAGQITVEITIFTLGDSCFRKTEQMVPEMVLFENGLYLEGALHWVNDWQDVKRGIIVFSLGKETFEPMMPLPPFDDDNVRMDNFRVKVICGKLTAFFSRTYQSGFLLAVEIWVMEDYGVIDSWSKKITVSGQSDDIFRDYLEPICFLRNGSVLLTSVDDGETDATQVLYDPKEKTLCTIESDPPLWRVNEYVETLVPPK